MADVKVARTNLRKRIADTVVDRSDQKRSSGNCVGAWIVSKSLKSDPPPIPAEPPSKREHHGALLCRRVVFGFGDLPHTSGVDPDAVISRDIDFAVAVAGAVVVVTAGDVGVRVNRNRKRASASRDVWVFVKDRRQVVRCLGVGYLSERRSAPI